MEYTGFQGRVTEVGEANRFALLAPPTVAGPTDFVPSSGSGLTMRLSAGAAMIAGVHIENTSTLTFSIPKEGTGYKWVIVGLRVTWGDTPSVEPFAKIGEPTVLPALADRPGDVVEMALAQVWASSATIGSVYDTRVWGGYGGPYTMSQADRVKPVRLPVGSEIRVADSLYQVTGMDGQWPLITLVDPQLRAWKPFVPNLYNDRGRMITATTFWKDGRYQIRDGACHVVVRLAMYGTIGNWDNADLVPYGMDLPASVGRALTDQWLDTETQYIGATSRFAGKILCREGASRGLLYVMADINDARIRVQNGRPEILTVHGSYLI